MANVNYNDYDERLLNGSTDTKYEEDPRTEKEPGDEDIYYQLPTNIKSRSLKWAVISLVGGILSLLLCPFYYVGLFFVAVSAGATAVSRLNLGYFEKLSIIGLTLSMIGLVCNVFSIVIQQLNLLG